MGHITFIGPQLVGKLTKIYISGFDCIHIYLGLHTHTCIFSPLLILIVFETFLFEPALYFIQLKMKRYTRLTW